MSTKAWRDTHKKERAAYQKKWARENAKHVRAYERKYRSSRPTLMRRKDRLYKLNNREAFRAKLRRAKVNGWRSLTDYYVKKHLRYIGIKQPTRQDIELCRHRLQIKRARPLLRLQAAAATLSNLSLTSAES